jgi:predicted DNA binding protein
MHNATQAKKDAKILAQEIVNNSPDNVSLRYFELDKFILSHILSTMNVSPYNNIPSLDPKQFEAIKTAWEMGYYRWPKKASLKDVASKLNLSMVSTLKRLRNAESKIIESYLKVYGNYDITPNLFNSSRSLSE